MKNFGALVQGAGSPDRATRRAGRCRVPDTREADRIGLRVGRWLVEHHRLEHKSRGDMAFFRNFASKRNQDENEIERFVKWL